MGKNYPLHIQKNHWDEWTIGSAVDPELTALNLESISEHTPYEYLLYNWNSGKVHPDAIARKMNRRFGDNWWHGGWWCSGATDSQWGCFKPDRPRFDQNKSKPIKYEHPPQTSTEIFRLKMPRHLWQRIANRYNIPIGNYLDFWQWVYDHPQIPITITEGVKKAAALLSQGYVSVALPGVWSGVRTPKNKYNEKIGKTYLIPELAEFAMSDRSFIMAFDQDAKTSTRRQVNQAIAATSALLKKAGCHVKIISWDAQYKGIDDFIVGCGSEALDQAIENAVDLTIWQASQLNQLTYAPDLTLNSRYLGDFCPPPDAQLIGLKAPKGTGKTFWLGKQVEPIIRNGGKKVLLLVHRIQLGSELCLRLGISYIDEERSDDFGLWGFGLCVDSLHPNSKAKINPEDFKGCDLILDECEQSIWHLLNSSTCQSDRVAILRTLKEIVETVLSTGGRIYLSDADLSDVSIDFIKSLVDFKVNQWIAVNEWKPSQGWDVYSYGGNTPDQLVGDLIEHIANGGKPFICTGSQKIKSKYGTQNLESLLLSCFPDLKIQRIDAESVADPKHSAFGCIERLNEILPNYDVVIASPTLETGVSIECDGFDSVWGIGPGHQPVNSVCQTLARYRPNVPRYIWAKSTGFGWVGNGATDTNSILKSEHKITKANINLLAQADFTDDIDTNFQPQSLRTWAKFAARINLEMKAYRASIEAKLQEEGHNIIKVSAAGKKEEIKAVKEAVAENKEQNYQEYRDRVSTAPDIDDKTYLKLKEQRSKTKQEREKYRKAELTRRYGVNISPELIEKDDSGWYRLLRLHYFYSIGREHLSARDKAAAQKMLDEGEGSIFKPDFNQKLLGVKIAVLYLIGFDKLLEKREFRQNDSELQAIADRCKANRFAIKSILGINIGLSETPIAIAQKLLGLIGYKFPQLRREGSRGDRQLIYGAAAAFFEVDCMGKLIKDDSGQAIPIPDGRDEVFAAWLLRDAAKEAAREASESRECQSPCQSFPNNTITDQNSIDTIDTIDTNLKDTTPDTPTIPTGEPSQVERLMASLARVESFGQFWEAIRGYEDETVEDAIALLDNHPRRQTLAAWFEGDASLTQKEVALDPFLEPESVQDLVGWLKICCREGKALFDILRQTIPSTEAFRRAVRFLDRERRAVIRYWEPGLV
ncbi:MAG: plasmid replication protein, CyRepA1 family [Phycisphaerales bacterium]